MGRLGKHVSLACDRCRSSKQKCTAHIPACSRCIRAGKECIYSPTTRALLIQSKRSSKRVILSSSSSEEGNLEAININGEGEMGNNNTASKKRKSPEERKEEEEEGAEGNQRRCATPSAFSSASTASPSSILPLIPSFEDTLPPPQSLAASSFVPISLSFDDNNKKNSSAPEKLVVATRTTMNKKETKRGQFQQHIFPFIPPTFLFGEVENGLLSIFIQEHLPHLLLSHGLPNSLDFIATLHSPVTASQQMQRDCAIALAAAGSGYFALANALTARIDQISEIVAQSSPSTDGFAAFGLYSALLGGADVGKGRCLQAASAGILRLAAKKIAEPIIQHELGRSGRMAQIVPLLPSEVLLGSSPSMDIRASVNKNAKELGMSFHRHETLRLFIALRMEILETPHAVLPAMQPFFVNLLTLQVELDESGSFFPSYASKIISCRDPRGLLGLSPFVAGNASPHYGYTLPQRSCVALLQKVAFGLEILHQAALFPSLAAPYSLLLDAIQSMILLRSGDKMEATEAANRALLVLSNIPKLAATLPSEILGQTLLLLCCVFVETENPVGMVNFLTILKGEKNIASPLVCLILQIVIDMFDFALAKQQQQQQEEQESNEENSRLPKSSLTFSALHLDHVKLVTATPKTQERRPREKRMGILSENERSNLQNLIDATFDSEKGKEKDKVKIVAFQDRDAAVL